MMKKNRSPHTIAFGLGASAPATVTCTRYVTKPVQAATATAATSSSSARRLVLCEHEDGGGGVGEIHGWA